VTGLMGAAESRRGDWSWHLPTQGVGCMAQQTTSQKVGLDEQTLREFIGNVTTGRLSRRHVEGLAEGGRHCTSLVSNHFTSIGGKAKAPGSASGPTLASTA
jgi:hypothetical protein